MFSRSCVILLILLLLHSNNNAFGLKCYVCNDLNGDNPECRTDPRNDKFIKDCTFTDPSPKDYARDQKSVAIEDSYLGWQCVTIEIKTNGVIKLARNCSPDCPSSGGFLGNNNYQMSIECCNTDYCNDQHNSSSKIIMNVLILSICLILKAIF